MEQRRAFRALVVEDDGAILRLVKTVLEREKFIVEGVRDGAAAVELLSTVAYDLLIVDLILPRMTGDQVLGYIEMAQPRTLRRVIVTTASPRQLSCEFLEKICRVLSKPFDVHELVLHARACVEQSAA